MNIKFNFISGTPITPENIIEQKNIYSKEYSKIVANIDTHYNLQNQLNSTWNKFIAFPEYEAIQEEDKFNVKSKSDHITIATVDNQSLADCIIELMNLAFREGAKIHRKRFSEGCNVASAVICTRCKKIISPAIVWPRPD
jgi:uncharacterized protein YjcR